MRQLSHLVGIMIKTLACHVVHLPIFDQNYPLRSDLFKTKRDFGILTLVISNPTM